MKFPQHTEYDGRHWQDAFVILHGSHNAFDVIGPYSRRAHADEDVNDFYPGATVARITPPRKRMYSLLPPPGYEPETELLKDNLSQSDHVTFLLTRDEYSQRIRDGWTLKP